MAERYHADLYIPTYMIDADLEAHIEQEGIRDQIDEDGITSLSDSHARYGEFEDLEQYLIGRNIPFDRYSEAHMEFQAEAAYYRPGMDEKLTVPVTTHLFPYVTTAELKPLLDLAPDEALRQLKDLIDEHDPYVKPITDYITERST